MINDRDKRAAVIFGVAAVFLMLVSQAALAFVPAAGTGFTYTEHTTVGNGAGVYTGYTDQTLYNGSEQITSVNGNVVSAAYDYHYVYSNNQESNTTTGSDSGVYTFSSTSFLYINGTDDQPGYVHPTVWFAMNNSLPVGGKFTLLNTVFTITGKNYSYYVPTLGYTVKAITAVGTGEYQRNDSYGVFNATYTWHAFFDPTSGYIIGYQYVEQDAGEWHGQIGSFTYTDNLYVTSTIYPLTITYSPPTAVTPEQPTFLGGIMVLAVIVIVVLLMVAFRGKRKKTDTPEYSTPPPPPVTVDLMPKVQPPVQQIVIREVAKTTCKFCDSLIPTTAPTCPVCGAPNK